MQDISIIIITYNRPGDTLELLQAIEQLHLKHEILKEVILLNNASSSDYSSVIAFINHHPQTKVRYIEAPENLGVSKGRNFAAAKATGDILFFLDDDIVLEDREILPGIVKAFSRPTEMDRRLGVISFKVRYTENRAIQVNAFPHKRYEQFKNAHWFLTGYYIGCAHAFLRECWLAAGNYPEDFFYGMEEYDQSYRVLDAGYAIGYDASVEVFHKESPLGRAPKAEKLRMMWVNKSVVSWTYLPLPNFITTALGWSAFYLRNTHFDLSGFLKGWGAVLKIPFSKLRRPIKNTSRAYLKQVQARLWF